jgi:hypothetical protein
MGSTYGFGGPGRGFLSLSLSLSLSRGLLLRIRIRQKVQTCRSLLRRYGVVYTLLGMIMILLGYMVERRRKMIVWR